MKCFLSKIDLQLFSVGQSLLAVSYKSSQKFSMFIQTYKYIYVSLFLSISFSVCNFFSNTYWNILYTLSCMLLFSLSNIHRRSFHIKTCIMIVGHLTSLISYFYFVKIIPLLVSSILLWLPFRTQFLTTGLTKMKLIFNLTNHHCCQHFRKI